MCWVIDPDRCGATAAARPARARDRQPAGLSPACGSRHLGQGHAADGLAAGAPDRRQPAKPTRRGEDTGAAAGAGMTPVFIGTMAGADTEIQTSSGGRWARRARAGASTTSFTSGWTARRRGDRLPAYWPAPKPRACPLNPSCAPRHRARRTGRGGSNITAMPFRPRPTRRRRALPRRTSSSSI